MSCTGRRSRRAGYTLIEVMMAVAVLTAGSVAIMAMFQASTRGNMEARQMATGTQIAQRWVERLRRDSLHWTRASLGADPLLLARTNYLRSVAAPGGSPAWFVPTTPLGETANFDYLGNDVGGGTAHFCTNLRLEWVYPGQAMRADVRVWWPRRDTGTFRNCAPGVDPNTLPTAVTNPLLQMVYTSTVIRYTPTAS